jgi:membrane-bound lytic murein transglycosylase D
VEQISAANPGLRPRYLKIGQRIMIPALKETEPYLRDSSGAEDRGLPVFEGTHMVKRGETLWSIALAYETDPMVLAEVNGMGLDDTLREGRVLKTPLKR